MGSAAAGGGGCEGPWGGFEESGTVRGDSEGLRGVMGALKGRGAVRGHGGL